MPLWRNADGLAVLSGRDEVGQGLLGPIGRGGEVNVLGPLRTVEFLISSEDFTATVYPTLNATRILSESTAIPAGYRIQTAQLFVLTAFAGATGTLDIGLVNQDGSTEVDFDGIDQTIAVAALTAGATITCDGALVGAGTNLSTTGLVMVRNATARFTAGRAVLRINLFNPL